MRKNNTSSSHITASVHKKKASILQVPHWQSHQTKVWSLKSRPEDPNIKSKNWNSHKHYFKPFFTAFNSVTFKSLFYHENSFLLVEKQPGSLPLVEKQGSAWR